MPEPVVYHAVDFQDLPFDVSRHVEALKSFAALDIPPRSVRPALRARDIVVVRRPSCRFRFGVALDAGAGAPRHGEGGESEVIHEAASADEARGVCADVERYFLRHFPGRTLSRASEATASATNGTVVTISWRPSE